MKTHVDRFGRVVIPKPIRLHLGLRTGAPLMVEEHEQAVLFRPVREEPPLIMKGGVLVFAGSPAGDLLDAVRIQREERLGRLAHRMAR